VFLNSHLRGLCPSLVLGDNSNSIPPASAGHPRSEISHANVKHGFCCSETRNPLLATRDVVGHILALKHCNDINLLCIRPPWHLLSFCVVIVTTSHLPAIGHRLSTCSHLLNVRHTCNNGMSLAHKHLPSATVRGLHKGPKSANKAQCKCQPFRKSSKCLTACRCY